MFSTDDPPPAAAVPAAGAAEAEAASAGGAGTAAAAGSAVPAGGSGRSAAAAAAAGGSAAAAGRKRDAPDAGFSSAEEEEEGATASAGPSAERRDQLAELVRELGDIVTAKRAAVATGQPLADIPALLAKRAPLLAELGINPPADSPGRPNFDAQLDAVLAAVRALLVNDPAKPSKRGLLVMPCGTGKSLTGLWVVHAHMRFAGVTDVLVLVPSLFLLGQLLSTYAEHHICGDDVDGSMPRAWHAVVICSDRNVVAGRDAESDTLASEGVASDRFASVQVLTAADNEKLVQLLGPGGCPVAGSCR
jgi:hypothetical protein